MICAYPVLAKLRVKDWKPGDPPWRYQQVPCGRCIACRLNKGRAWSVRIMNEVKHVCASCFCTLTYDDDHRPVNGSLSLEHVQKFLKRLRRNTGKKVRYFLGAEYGEKKERPHYHVIFFGLGREDAKAIESAWGMGFVHVGDVTPDSAAYVAGYTLKKLSGDKAAEYYIRGLKPEFGLMSRRPGIGQCYVDDPTNVSFVRNNGFVVRKGSKCSVPRFYSDRIFTTEDLKNERRQKLQAIQEQRFKESLEKRGGKYYDAESGLCLTQYIYNEAKQAEINLQKKQDMKKRRF